jgi:hypothetical protein
VSIGGIKETFRDEKRRMKVEKAPKRTLIKPTRQKSLLNGQEALILSVRR